MRHLRTLLFLYPFLLAACAVQTPQEVEQPIPSAPAEVLPAEPAIVSSAPSVAELQLLPLEQRSRRYTNETLGFSLLIPTYLVRAGQCEYQPKPVGGYPVKVLEDGDAAIITPAMYGYTTYEKASEPEKCTNVDVTLETIKQDMTDRLFYPYGWKMVTKKGIANDDDLLAFVREWYGSGCSIQAKNPAEQDGVYDIKMAGDTGDDTAEASDCPLNFAYALKYSPAKEQAMTWKIGQDGRFEDLDAEMFRSFQFE